MIYQPIIININNFITEENKQKVVEIFIRHIKKIFDQESMDTLYWYDKNKKLIQVLEIINQNNKQIGIQEVLEINTFVSLKSKEKKIIFIFNAELMTDEAQNSILKLLEEITDSTFILMFTSKIEKILQTIISRCIVLNVDLTNTNNFTGNQYDKIKNFFEMDLLEKEKFLDQNFVQIKINNSELIEIFLNYLTQNNFIRHNKKNTVIIEKLMKLKKIMDKVDTVNYNLLLNYLILVFS